MSFKTKIVKNHKKIISIIFLAAFIYFNPFFLIKRNHKRIYRDQFNTVVIDKYFTNKDRRRRYVELKRLSSNESFFFFTPNANKEIFDIVNVGDTLIKQRDSFNLEIKNGKKFFNINIESTQKIKNIKDLRDFIIERLSWANRL